MRRVIGILLRLFLFLSGAAGFMGLAMPLVKKRILNIGNVAGLTACAAMMFYALLTPYVNRLIGKWWQTKAGKIILSVIGLGIAAGIVLVLVMSVCMIRAAYVKPAQNATAIVLGCRVHLPLSC